MTDEQAAPQEGKLEVLEAQTAFLVILTKEGKWLGHYDINLPVTTQRPAGPDDMKAGTACVAQDVHTSEIAQATTMSVLQNLMNMGQQMQQAANGPPVPDGMNMPGGVPLLRGRG